MKQPKIRIFGKEYKVMQLKYDRNGALAQVIYQESETSYLSVFKGDSVPNQDLTTSRKIQKPTKHPYHNYAFSPHLESLLY